MKTSSRRNIGYAILVGTLILQVLAGEIPTDSRIYSIDLTNLIAAFGTAEFIRGCATAAPMAAASLLLLDAALHPIKIAAGFLIFWPSFSKPTYGLRGAASAIAALALSLFLAFPTAVWFFGLNSMSTGLVTLDMKMAALCSGGRSATVVILQYGNFSAVWSYLSAIGLLSTLDYIFGLIREKR